MSRVYRQQYTRPIPPDAVRVTVKDKKGRAVLAVRFKDQGKTITAPITQKGKGAGKLCRVPSPVWYGRYIDADGHSTPVLTARYSHRRLYDLAGAIEKLPSFLPTDRPAGILQATGTDPTPIRDK